jgi:hypothetical protein
METQIYPYQFEPEYSDSEDLDYTELEDEDSELAETTKYIGRQGTSVWCLCSKCSVMQSDHESLCCQESDTIAKVRKDFQCITLNPAFQNTILSVDSLNISRHQLIRKTTNQRKKRTLTVDEPKNNLWRYLAYKQFVSWINSWTAIGKGNRIVIPSCVVMKIRECFPDENGAYVGFRTTDVDGNPKWPG